MNYPLDLARRLAEDRRLQFTDRHPCRHPKASWSRHVRRTIRVAARRDESSTVDGH